MGKKAVKPAWQANDGRKSKEIHKPKYANAINPRGSGAINLRGTSVCDPVNPELDQTSIIKTSYFIKLRAL